MPQRTATEDLTLLRRQSHYHALLMAVQRYDSDQIRDLDHPVNDAHRLRDTLLDRYDFQTEHVQLLENPDRSQVVESLEKQAAVVTPGDSVLIFFAGHGFWDPDRNQGYWWPKDSRPESRSGWISNSDIRDLVVGIKCRHTLLISDACFSGGLFKTRSGTNVEYAIEKLYSLPSRKAMTSGALDEVPDQSVFLKYLTERLATNDEMWLSSERLFADLKEPVLNNGPNVPQYGAIHGAGDEGGDFVFRRRGAPDLQSDSGPANTQPEENRGNSLGAGRQPSPIARHPGKVNLGRLAIWASAGFLAFVLSNIDSWLNAGPGESSTSPGDLLLAIFSFGIAGILDRGDRRSTVLALSGAALIAVLCTSFVFDQQRGYAGFVVGAIAGAAIGWILNRKRSTAAAS